MTSTRRGSLRGQVLSVVCLVVLCGSTAVSQQAARPERGTMPNRTYSLSDIENISLQNGNVNLSIPLASLPPIAGGKLSWTVSANYNSKLWNSLRAQADYPNDLQWNPYIISSPSLDGGWSIGGQYVMEVRSSNDDFSRLFYPGNSGLTATELNLLNNYSYFKVVLHTPDGAEHEFRPIDYSPYGSSAGAQDFLRGYFNVLPNGTPIRYYSVDGTYMFATISDEWNWTVYMPDGTQVIQTPDGIQRIKDTNGNKIKIFSDANGTHYQDEQTNREIRTLYDPSGNGGQGQTRVWYPTVTGIQHHIDINHGTSSVQGKLYFVSDWDPNGGGSGGAECQRTVQLSTQLSVVREIVFPQTEPTQAQQRFTFSYNSDSTVSTTSPVNWQCGTLASYTRQASRGWGELSQMVTPSGSITDYSYTLDLAHILLGPIDDLSMQSIAEKQVTHDGTSDTWTYGVSDTGGGMSSPDGNNFSETRYCSSTCLTGGKAGLAYRTTRPFMMTERHWTNLTFSDAKTISPGGDLTFNPVVDREYTTLLDASNNPLKMSAKAFQYDFNGNVTQTTEYDWFDPGLVARDPLGVPTGVPASATVLRVTSNSFYNQASSASSANVYAKRSVSTGAPLILNATQQSTVGPAIVQLSYDGQAYGVAPTAGNLTTKKVWDDLDNKWITTSNTYDLYGNVATATDGRGKVTQFFYDDATHALPNRIVVDPQNGTGTQTAGTAYDFSTGLVTSQTDVNGQVTSIEYTNHLLGAVDPFGRPGIMKSPTVNINNTNHRRRVTTTYLDTTRKVIVETDLNAEDDKLLKTRTTTDMLGRPILSESTEDGTNYTISARNAYLDMGRVTLTSGPMRSTGASNDSWTRVTRDTAGRVTHVATFGGATQPAWTGTAGAFTGVVTTEYYAEFTTVTDQAGKVRRSMVDGLGRLVRVDEPDVNGNLGSTISPVQKTEYEYDVFGNLKKVSQGAQQRTFTYDSLSRLRTAINPESGTVTYQYDDSANLIVKTDARGVSTHYDYDSLNRLTRRWYNGSSSTSQLTHNVPALPSGVGATDEVKFYYDSQTLPGGAPSYARGLAVGRLVAQTYGSGSNGDYYAYDLLGRPTLKFQQTGTVNYQLSAGYTLAGAVSTLTYPSGHTISNTFDQAGRLSVFSGNLGDGTARTYSTGSVYSALGSLLREQFGTNTPVYHKRRYNSRAQLCDVRASSVNDESGGELGALVNYYNYPYSHCGNGPDNNGNVLMSQTIINSVHFEDRYSYDSLNRLTAVNEYLNGATPTGKQEYDYDRWGNRTLKPTSTLGTYKEFTVNTANNRLGVPAGQPGAMGYDNAGNLINDTYTGAGNRTYDGENKITSAWGGNNQAQLYGYDGSGQRIKRTVDGVTTWQIYGFGGELLAEYPANGSAANPQKEYGYRNGQLLVTAEAGTRTNVALASNGATATASSTLSPYYPEYVINGARRAVNSDVWLDNTSSSFPDWVEVSFNGSKTISEIAVITQQDDYQNPIEPTLAQTFSLYGITAFDVQYWTGSTWATVPGGSVTGNDKVWRQFTFSPLTTTKIRVLVNAGADNAYSRVIEVEAWTGPGPANYALPANGGTATASSTLSPYYPQYVINGARRAVNSDVWADSTISSFPDWVEVSFNGSKTISEIDVITQQDDYQNPIEPTLTQTFSLYGITAFDVQYWTGSTWATVPGGSVTGNDKVWRQFTFSPLTTTKIRVLVNAGADNAYSRVVEVEAWGGELGATTSKIHWLVTDHLGTPRMIIDQTGTLAKVKRHDYLPFGEELFAGTGGRTAPLGYAGGDGVRQQFTAKERDVETGLDYFLARYYSPSQGRFTSTDPGSFVPADPQSWNRYLYTQNNPLKFTDPTGEDLYIIGDYADAIVADLEVFSGFKLQRDAKTGKVTIDPKQKRKGKGTSYALARALGRAIGNEKVSVSIQTVSESKNNVEIIGDRFADRKLDIDDYNVFKRDAPEFAAGFLTHVVTEYYEEQLLPAPLSTTAIFTRAHGYALEAESDTIGDLNGWWQAPRKEQLTSGSLTSPPMTMRVIYSTVEYDVVYKTGVRGRGTQAEKVTRIDKTPKKPK